MVLWSVPVAMLVALASCEHEADPLPSVLNEPAAPAVDASSRFDAAKCGTITGRVTWAGEIPKPEPFLFGMPASDGNFSVALIPNPNSPAIEPASRAVKDAVMFLRGIDPARAKPWDHAPVRIEMKDRNLRVNQGETTGRVGFVRRGDTIEMKSAEPVFHVLRARGAAFFSLTFPQPDSPLTRKLDTAGRVELSSGSGFYWASADLFVSDHPYWTRTDSTGHYTFTNVPDGDCEVVAWLPNWTVTKMDRDPETGLITRQTYGTPIEMKQSVRIGSGRKSEADFELTK
jgi:hypothetical protein